jgi:hypothetical protein
MCNHITSLHSSLESSKVERQGGVPAMRYDDLLPGDLAEIWATSWEVEAPATAEDLENSANPGWAGAGRSWLGSDRGPSDPQSTERHTCRSWGD